MKDLSDTIVAISTPIGKAGIGIVRLSGPKAVAISDRIFLAKDKVRPSAFKSHTVHYGWIAESQKSKVKSQNLNIIDEVLVTVMKAPRTYTKQDIVEINCHSGIAVLKRVLELAIQNGARLAEPGEFTRRAFLNGRIDLSQAEAVLDVINSRTDVSLDAATRQLVGGLSKKVSGMRDELLDLLAQLEASIDFSGEDIEIVPEETLRLRLTASNRAVDELLKGAQAGAALRDGITCVIWGRPNVGKSSLMNCLLERERVIVTPIAGTTRDSVEEAIDIKGVPIRLVDTAGVREPKDLTEDLAVKKAYEYLQGAGLVLFVLDGSQPLTEEDILAAKDIGQRQCIAVVNKVDLGRNIDLDRIKEVLGPDTQAVNISATKSMGIGLLKDCISGIVWAGGVDNPLDILVTNTRHKIALQEARDCLNRAMEAIAKRFSAEFVAVDIRDAINSLGEITGQAIDDGVLDRIFSQFCIGK